jgi:hypothetical protein
MSTTHSRPTGITILFALHVIVGIVWLSFGALIGALSPMLMFIPFLNVIGPAISAISLAIGIAFLGLSWGLWKAKPWAWSVSMGLNIISLILSIVSFNIIDLILHGVILYYLTRPHVKAYFGKGTF